MRRGSRIAGVETLVGVALLGAALVVGLATVSDYGWTVDEFNADDYGPKALAWYTSGFTDRSHFETVEIHLWYYGPWFHILVGPGPVAEPGASPYCTAWPDICGLACRACCAHSNRAPDGWTMGGTGRDRAL